jgi:large subunit ribosomal protein L4
MITASSVNAQGETGEKIKLPEEIFGVKPNPILLAQAVRVFLSNQRRATAKTKTRGEVAKTTAKMYRQKGTGRARHGSYSAPIFVGGGKVFGPTGEQNYKLRLSKKLIRLALVEALSDKAREQKVIVLSDIQKVAGKTKKAKKIINKEREVKGHWLLVVGEKEKTAARAFKNLVGVTVVEPNQLNTYTVLANQRLIITPDSLKEMVNLYVTH